MMDALSTEIAEIMGRETDQIAPLTGVCVGELFRVWLADGQSVVAKTGQPGDPLDVEGWMLEYLGEHSTLPVPEVYLSRDSLLVMSYIDGEDALFPASEIHAAEFLEELPTPSLLHGDVWGGNILVHGDHITGFVDPAIYYGDPEIELSFATMFSNFGEGFLRRYGELRPLRPDFFDICRDLYNLWPLLIHALLFGGGYVKGVETTLTRPGF